MAQREAVSGSSPRLPQALARREVFSARSSCPSTQPEGHCGWGYSARSGASSQGAAPLSVNGTEAHLKEHAAGLRNIERRAQWDSHKGAGDELAAARRARRLVPGPTGLMMPNEPPASAGADPMAHTQWELCRPSKRPLSGAGVTDPIVHRHAVDVGEGYSNDFPVKHKGRVWHKWADCASDPISHRFHQDVDDRYGGSFDLNGFLQKEYKMHGHNRATDPITFRHGSCTELKFMKRKGSPEFNMHLTSHVVFGDYTPELRRSASMMPERCRHQEDEDATTAAQSRASSARPTIRELRQAGAADSTGASPSGSIPCLGLGLAGKGSAGQEPPAGVAGARPQTPSQDEDTNVKRRSSMSSTPSSARQHPRLLAASMAPASSTRSPGSAAAKSPSNDAAMCQLGSHPSGGSQACRLSRTGSVASLSSSTSRRSAPRGPFGNGGSARRGGAPMGCWAGGL